MTPAWADPNGLTMMIGWFLLWCLVINALAFADLPVDRVRKIIAGARSRH